MHSITVEVVSAYRVEVEAGHTTLEGLLREERAGIKFPVRVSDDLYEWLRTTAFHARTSINAVVVAALAHAQADATEGTHTTDAD